jgi:hypothetical protein
MLLIKLPVVVALALTIVVSVLVTLDVVALLHGGCR